MRRFLMFSLKRQERALRKIHEISQARLKEVSGALHCIQEIIKESKIK